MKKFRLLQSLLYAGVFLFLFSCNNENDSIPVASNPIISENILQKISEQGYNNENVQIIENRELGKGYLVEGDIILFDHDLNSKKGGSLVIAEEEHYRTTLVPKFGSITTVTDRTTGQLVTSYRQSIISILFDSSLPPIYLTALRNAADRYNALAGSSRFKIYVYTSFRNPDITVRFGSGGYLAAAGFPFNRTTTDRSGNQTTTVVPYNEILVNSNAIRTQTENHIATILAHEIGHCIGFRHTDYMNRSYSGCQQASWGYNESNAPGTQPGAIHIAGTPTGPDAGSWMLACIGDGVDRPFVNNDRIALRAVHGF